MSGVAAAVLFDMDGLLVDSEPLWTVAEEELAAEFGGVWSEQIKAAIVGTRLDVSVPAILEWYAVPPTPDRVEWAASFLLRRMVELFESELPLAPGAVTLLDALGARRVPVGLVSSSYRVLVEAALGQLGRERFAVTLAGDEVGHGKPHPEPYLTACAALGVDPAGCVVLEDAPSGIAAAEAAGCIAVAVPSVAAIVATPRRPVVESLADIDPDWLLSLPDHPAAV
ncbi:MAG TPA: HAD family phosphatase [Mycobacteriales bacterium]|nr:HAD family phosphatase [Mycobacteriales bacterium]